MAYFDRHTKSFRLVFGIFAAFLLYIAVFNFYQFASRPTDENVFTFPPSPLYVTKNFPGKLLELPKFKAESDRVSADSIRTGNFLDSINGMRFKNVEMVNKILVSNTADSTVKMVITKHGEKQKVFYEVKKADIPNSFLRKITSCASATDVDPSGASECAGMRVGDLIIRLRSALHTGTPLLSPTAICISASSPDAYIDLLVLIASTPQVKISRPRAVIA